MGTMTAIGSRSFMGAQIYGFHVSYLIIDHIENENENPL